MNKTTKWVLIGTAVLVVVLVILSKTGVFGKAEGIKVTAEKTEVRTIIEVVNASGKIYPEVEVKVPLVRVNIPAHVQVVQDIVPMLLSVPPLSLYVAVLEQVKLKVAKLMSPAVCVYVVQPNAAANVVVPAWLTVNAAIVLPLGVMVPVPRIVAVNPVYTPAPLDSVNALRFNEVVGSVNAVVPKSNLLNQLAVVIVNTEIPDPVNVKLGAVVALPPVVPNVNVLVISAAAVNPPVPVYVNPVAVAISRFVAAAVVVANTILPVPKLILRVLLLFELNVPVVKVNPAKSNVPAVSV